MNHIQEKYLDLLKAAMWGGEVTNEGVKELTNERVNEIIRLAVFQGIGPLVYDQLLKLKDVDIPADLRMQMKQQCVSNMMLQQSMSSLLSQAWTALKEAEVHPILLKGFALAQYYPQPYLRQWGDIDIYVGKVNYHKACGALRIIFPNVHHPKEEYEDFKHYNFDFSNTAIELHRISMEFAHPRDRRYYEALEEKYLTKDGPSFDCDGLSITMPENTFNIFFTFLHAWHHFIETGMNMKQLCDIAVLLHAKREEIDRERLRAMLNRMCLMDVWQLFMYILVQHLGLSQAEAPFYTERCKERAELLFKRILQEGSSRKQEPTKADSVSYLKRKWMTFQSRMADSRLAKPYAPRYARHKVVGDLFHGIKRMVNCK